MAEYIKREAAVKIAEKYGLECGSVLGRHSGLADCIAREISELPAADVAPVVHGRWDDSLDGITPYCSICGQSHRMMIRTPNYCPNCGAKMDGGADHSEEV